MIVGGHEKINIEIAVTLVIFVLYNLLTYEIYLVVHVGQVYCDVIGVSGKQHTNHE